MAGLADPYGVILGGIVIGVIENISILFISGAFKDVISFVILIIIMLLKPRGIFNWTSKGE
jgi:branched-chain amino acid transport system permease protein